MTKIDVVGSDIRRGGERIGWIEGEWIKDNTGERLGYFDDTYVYNAHAQKIAYIEGDYLCSYDQSVKVRLGDVAKEVSGNDQPGIEKCAIYMLFGE